MIPPPPRSTLFPYTTLFRSVLALLASPVPLLLASPPAFSDAGMWTFHDFPRELVKGRSEEHTSELQSRVDLVCRLLLEKKKKKKRTQIEYEHKIVSQT